MESKEKFVSLLTKGEVELELNGENHKIPLSNIGISFEKEKRKIKISSISRYYYDEKSNTYIIVNSKFIKDVIRELQVKGYTGNSVNLE
jgi:predicted trehalose synthase